MGKLILDLPILVIYGKLIFNLFDNPLFK